MKYMGRIMGWKEFLDSGEKITQDTKDQASLWSSCAISERANISEDIARNNKSNEFLTKDATFWGLRFFYGINMQDMALAKKAYGEIQELASVVVENKLGVTPK